MKHMKVFYCILLPFTIVFALEPARANLEPEQKLRGDEIINTEYIPYLHGRKERLPYDTIIGTTAYDYQASGGFGQRIMLDKNDQAHINWMKMDIAQSVRFCAWNARYFDGTYYGETQASNSWSGYVQLDVTRDSNPDNQRTVVCYHYNPGQGYYSWIDIDLGQLWGSWPNNPRSPEVEDHLWPYIAAVNNGNIIMATGDHNANMLHLYLTTDEGSNWTNIVDSDSCAVLSQFVRASLKPGSNKVVFIWTKFITDTVAAGQLDNDVYYMLSSDGGVTWDAPVNITNYQLGDSVRAYCNVNAVFDRDDKLHIAWAGRKVTDNYYEASKIFHWCETNDTITVISSPSYYYNEPGGWWITVTGAGDPGAWRMPADQPQLVVDTISGYLCCLWQGNDDYNDYSAAGYFNGEIYMAISTDNGITWSQYVNLTNTRSPGAGAGACMDEDYLTVYPICYPPVMFFRGVLTYVEDKDAGAWPQVEGILTENPVHCYYCFSPGGISEDHVSEAQNPVLKIHPNPFSKQTKIKFQAPNSKNQVTMNIYDATGKLVKDFSLSTAYGLQLTMIQWSGKDQLDRFVPAGVYFVRLESEDCTLIRKVIKLK